MCIEDTKTYIEDNIFNKIIKKEIPAKIIFENTHALSFYDINPLAKIHALVIPKGNYIDALDFTNASAEEIKSLQMAIFETAKILKVNESGFRLISNCGINGGQEVPHFHYHILGGEKIGKMVNK